MDKSLFFKVFNNLYIRNQISSHIKLFQDNSIVTLNSASEYNKYDGLEYIVSLEYNGYSLPSGGFNILHLSELEISKFKGPLKVNQINSICLQRLELKALNTPLEPYSIPSSLTELYLEKYNHPLSSELFQSLPLLKMLILGEFNQKLNGQLVHSTRLESLEMLDFNQELCVGDIPCSVVELNLNNYDKPIGENVIPNSVEWIYLHWFNQPLQSTSLPSSLIILNLENFDQQLLPNQIPASVNDIYFNSYNQLLAVGVLPHGLSILSLGDYNQPIHAGVLPSSLTELSLISFDQPLEVGSLPSSIKKLTMYYFNQELQVSHLPSQLTELRFKRLFNKPLLKDVIPATCQIIDLSSDFNQPLQEGSIPSSCTDLTLGYCFSHSINSLNLFSSNLKRLKLDKSYKDKSLTIPDELNNIIIY